MAAEALSWLFVAATIAALLALLRAGWARRFPVFLLFLALQAWQGAAVNLTPELHNAEWWLNSWVPVERFRIALAILSGIELLYRVTNPMRTSERWSLIVSMLLAAAFARLLYSPAAEPLAAFLAVRVAIWSGICIGMFMLVIHLLVEPLDLPSDVNRHLVLFCVLMAAHAFIAPLIRITHVDWVKEQAVFRAVATACCLLWTMFVAESNKQSAGEAEQHLPAFR